MAASASRYRVSCPKSSVKIAMREARYLSRPGYPVDGIAYSWEKPMETSPIIAKMTLKQCIAPQHTALPNEKVVPKLHLGRKLWHLAVMEYRTLGHSGLKVPVLSFGTGTFGGKGEFFNAWGSSDVAEAARLVDICLEAGVNLFDTADVYSKGVSEEILGKALKGRRTQVLISTKTTFRMGDGPNDLGSSRHHILEACEASLKRLGTDYIDIYHMHGFDAQTPVEETLSTLDGLVKTGKVRYIACSNFSGWHLMKSLSVCERHGLTRYAAHQVYYSLIGREYEWELMPLGLDQKVAAIIWSPLGWGRLTGKLRRGAKLPETSRLHSKASNDAGPPVDQEYLYTVV